MNAFIKIPFICSCLVLGSITSAQTQTSDNEISDEPEYLWDPSKSPPGLATMEVVTSTWTFDPQQIEYVAEDAPIVGPGNHASTPNPRCIGSGGVDASARCKTLYVAIPVGATVTEVKYKAREVGGGWSRCTTNPNQHCPVGWSRFLYPRRATSGGYQHFYVQFRNWKHDQSRQASMEVHWEY